MVCHDQAVLKCKKSTLNSNEECEECQPSDKPFFFCLLFYINVYEMSTNNGNAGLSVPSSSVESGKKVTDVFVR